MNECYESLLNRRSVRKYKAEMPPKEEIEKIILAITNRELRDRLMEMNRVIGGWKEGFDPFYGAPVVLLVLADKSSPNHVYDGSLTMGNLMQAAYDLGFGSCWINRAREEFASEEGKAILKELGIEGDWEGIGHCIVGYVDGDLPKAADRKENRVFWAE